MKIKKIIFSVTLVIATFYCNAQVSIIANYGKFISADEAAFAELKVNWTDPDLTDDRACTESFAALELAKFLPMAAVLKRNEIRIILPEKIPGTGDVFIIGSRFSNKLIRGYDFSGGKLSESDQSFIIKSFKDNNRIITVIEGGDRTGVLYGVYRYLEEMDVRFIGLGEKGIITPVTKRYLPENLDITEKPSYRNRGFYSWGDRKTDQDFFLWMARNKMNYWTAENQPVFLLKKLGLKLSEGGHIIQGTVFVSEKEYPYNHKLFKGDEHKPADPYSLSPDYAGDVDKDGRLSNFEAHPEWHGLRDGKRIRILSEARHGVNFCTSNEDARREFAIRVVHELISGVWKYADIFNFMSFDGGENYWCSCDKCRSYKGSFTNKMFLVTNEILKELKKAQDDGRLNRRIEVSNIAYLATLDPPAHPLPADYDYENSSVTFYPIRRCYVHAFADPSCTEINQWQLRAYQGWTTGENRFYKGSMFIGEYYNVSSLKSLPVVFTKIMAIDIPWYWQSGARNFHYMHSPHKFWGTWTVNQYLMGKLLWNIEVDATTVINDYFKYYYPTTTASTRKFYENLEKASANIKALKHTAGLNPETNFVLANRLLKGNIFELDHLHYDEYHPLVNDGPDIIEIMDAVESARLSLSASLVQCSDLMEKQRLVEDQLRFDYGYAMYHYIFHMLQTSIYHKQNDKDLAKREFSLVEKYADQLRNMIDVVQVASDHANAENGLEATGSVKVYEEFKKIYGN